MEEGLRPGSLIPQDLQVQMDEDARQHEQLREECSLQERRLSLLQTELDEVHSALEGSERARKLLEQEVAEVTERHSELSVQVGAAPGHVDSHAGRWGEAGAAPQPQGLPSKAHSADPQNAPAERAFCYG